MITAAKLSRCQTVTNWHKNTVTVKNNKKSATLNCHGGKQSQAFCDNKKQRKNNAVKLSQNLPLRGKGKTRDSLGFPSPWATLARQSEQHFTFAMEQMK
jgi:hypothetical protein